MSAIAGSAPGQAPSPVGARSVTARLAGAPISWGVCEVPGWGHQLDPARVLAEMNRLGLPATEFGPCGFLPADPAERGALLGSYGLTAIGGFVPVVLHDQGYDPLPEIDRVLAGFGSATMLVLAAATGLHGYDERPDLDAAGWRTLLANLERISARVAATGRQATLHPHVGTMVERAEEVHRVLDGSAIPLCLDTGHLLIGGTDPLALARGAASRIGHVHLKDVAADLAAAVRDGRLDYTQGVRAGMYRPLGAGDVDVAGIVTALEGAGYGGWYVMEQDTILDVAPAADGGPIEDVRASLAFLAGATP